MIEIKDLCPRFISGENSDIWKKTIRIEKPTLITAESGSGKSSFIQLLYGLLPIEQGSIFIEDQNLRSLNRRQWSSLRSNTISIVFQDLRLIEQLTGFQNIQLKNDLTNHLDESKIEELLKEAGILQVAHQKVNTLSQGQKQRVAIIRALCQPHKWLFLDEPFSHLDRKNTRVMAQMILRQSQAIGSNILLTSLGEDYQMPFHNRFQL